jgi:hypothetical protein
MAVNVVAKRSFAGAITAVPKSAPPQHSADTVKSVPARRCRFMIGFHSRLCYPCCIRLQPQLPAACGANW